MEENQLNNTKTTINVPTHLLLRLRATLKWKESYAEKITELLDLYDKVHHVDTVVEPHEKTYPRLDD